MTSTSNHQEDAEHVPQPPRGPQQARGPGRRRFPVKRAAATVAVSMGLAALAAGCGGSGNHTPGSSASSSRLLAQYFAYSRCMRSHGVPNFPDPHVSISPGRVAVGFRVTPAETRSPRFKSADHACQGILPAPNNPTPAGQRARTAGLLAFARCVRANGVAGFPDPDAQGRLTLEMVSAAGVDIHAHKVLDAAKACVGASHGAVKLADIEAAESRAH